MASPKITLIGAGGLSFGPTMVNDVVHTPALAGSRLMLQPARPPVDPRLPRPDPVELRR